MSKNWIFIRGLTRGVFHWGEFAKKFQDLHPDYKIEFLEIPGNGELSELITPDDPIELINFLRSKSKIIQSGDEYHLCGISLGGMIVLKWAELYPNKIESVNVINTSLSQFSPFFQRLKIKNYTKIFLGLLVSNTSLKERLILGLTANNHESFEKNLANFVDYSKHHPVKRANFFRQLKLAKRIKIENWKKIKLNVITCHLDKLVDSKCSIVIAEKLNGNLVIHPTAGHDLPLDDSEWLIQALETNN
jgi:pimeloyl-ACP methyl ester carboxylesterase